MKGRDVQHFFQAIKNAHDILPQKFQQKEKDNFRVGEIFFGFSSETSQ